MTDTLFITKGSIMFKKIWQSIMLALYAWCVIQAALGLYHLVTEWKYASQKEVPAEATPIWSSRSERGAMSMTARVVTFVVLTVVILGGLWQYKANQALHQYDPQITHDGCAIVEQYTQGC